MNINMPDVDLLPVQKNFDAAAETYHEVSVVQAEMARALIDMLPGQYSPAKVLELGCGTGHLTLQLLKAFPGAAFVISDFSSRMLEQCQERILPKFPASNTLFKLQDAEQDFQMSDAALVSSNAMFQWVKEPLDHLKLAAKSLIPGGYYLFSGFNKQNFPQLNQALKDACLSGDGDFGLDRHQIESSLDRAGFSINSFSEATWTRNYFSLMDFLKILKKTGANRIQEKIPNVLQLKILEKSYREQFSREARVEVTWRPWFCLARKK